MTSIRPIFILVFLACISCSQHEFDECKDMQTAISVQFIASENEYVTRGENPLSGDRIYSMGVFAGYEEENDFSSESVANDYINNVRYGRSSTAEPFAGEDVCYWPFNGKLSFFAYAPYINDAYIHATPDYEKGFPMMEYMPTPDVVTQNDLCIAKPVLNRLMSTDPIPLSFHHALSQVVFSANFIGDIPASHMIKVDEIVLYNVIGKKVFSFNDSDDGFSWQDDEGCDYDTSYTLTRTHDSNSQIADVGIPKQNGENYQKLDLPAGVMYLVPQSLEKGIAYLKVTYGYYRVTSTGDILVTRVTRKVNLPEDCVWESSKRYRFAFSLKEVDHSDIKATVTIEDWQNSGNPTTDHLIW